MDANPLQHITTGLSRANEWAVVDHAWQESEGLHAALRDLVSASLLAHVVQVRREDPPKGIRGSQLTVVAHNSAIAAKLRLALADSIPRLQATGWGIQHIRVVAQRIQDITPVAAPAAPRRTDIPAYAKAALGALARSTDNEALRRALNRISQRDSRAD